MKRANRVILTTAVQFRTSAFLFHLYGRKQIRSVRILLLVTMCAFVATSQDVGGQVTYQTIAFGGQPAPGTSGANYGLLFQLLPPMIDAGQVAYFTSLAPSGYAIYAGSYASPQLVARSGDAAPGTPAGTTYSIAPSTTIAVNDGGQALYLSDLGGTTSGGAIFAGSAGATQLVARQGIAAPGTPAGVFYASFATLPVAAINDTGQVIYTATLGGSGVTSANDVAIYAGSVGSLQIVAREGASAPGTGTSYGPFGFGTPALNDAGQVAYTAQLTTGEVAILGGALAAPQLVARVGNAAPGTPAGVNYAAMNRPSLNDAGQIAYSGSLTGTGVTSANGTAIFAGSLATPQLVVRGGDAAPGAPAGVTYANVLSAIAINNVGQISFSPTLSGTGVTTSNDTAIYAGSFASPHLIVREGDPAPGTPAGVSFSTLGTPALNDDMQVALTATLTGTGVTTNNDRGLFLFDPTLGGLLIAREGDLFDIGGGDLRTIADGGISFASGRSDDTNTGLSNDQRLVFALKFTDNFSGVFTAAVPEPAGLLLLAVAAMWARRRT